MHVRAIRWALGCVNSPWSEAAGTRYHATWGPIYGPCIPVIVPEVVDVVGGAASHGAAAVEVGVGAVLVERLEDGIVAQLDVGQEGRQVLHPTATT